MPPQIELDAVRADGDMTLMVLGGPYGIDRKGQEFDAETDFGDLPLVPAIYYHGWGQDDGERIGWAQKAERDAAGQWYRVTLDGTKAIARKIYEDAKAGTVRASSDAIAHLVRPMEALKGVGGKIKRWVIGALSLMDSATYEKAINPRAVALPALRAYYQELVTGLESEDSGEAAKAGAVFARRNRERIEAMRKLLDELLTEFPESSPFFEPAQQQPEGSKAMPPDTTTTTPAVETVAAVATPVIPVQPQPDITKIVSEAVSAAVKAQFDEMDRRVTEANRPKWSAPQVSVNVNQSVEAVAVKAYDNYIRHGDTRGYNEWADAAKAEADKVGDETKFTWAVKAALNEGTTSQGGYLVPTQYSNEMIQAINVGSVYRTAGVRQLSMDGTNAFKVPTLTNSTKAILTIEATNYSEVEPTFGEITATPYKYTRLVKYSEEVLADSRFPLDALINADVANAFVLAENDAFTVGTGNSQPQGLSVGITLGITAAATNTVTVDELISTQHALAAQYRTGAKWFMKDSTLALVRKFREYGTTGAYLYQPAISAGAPSTLLGDPIVIVPDMPAATTGLTAIVYGNPQWFWIFDWGPMYVQRLVELYAQTGQIGLRYYKRFDSHVMLAAGFTGLKIA